MPGTANAFRQRQLVVRAPGKEPGLHVLMPDVMPGFHLAVGLAQLRQQPSLHSIGRACVRHEHILTPDHDFQWGSRGRPAETTNVTRPAEPGRASQIFCCGETIDACAAPPGLYSLYHAYPGLPHRG
jgi:hypothetical protein